MTASDDRGRVRGRSTDVKNQPINQSKPNLFALFLSLFWGGSPKMTSRAEVVFFQCTRVTLFLLFSVCIAQNKFLNKIMSWLEECEITYTQTAKPWNWKAMMADIRSDNRFYLDTDEDGERKPAGWCVSTPRAFCAKRYLRLFFVLFVYFVHLLLTSRPDGSVGNFVAI